MPIIEKVSEIGFCFGVRRAVRIVSEVARECGGVETLGPVVHNEQVLNKLAGLGVKVAGSVGEIKGDTVVVSAHGISPEVERAIRQRDIKIVDTTCPFVHRAQQAARGLAEAGFFVVVYGEANHTEVKGILGCAGGRGLATMDGLALAGVDNLPRNLGVLSQTTQIPARFSGFVKSIIDATFDKDSELRVIDTICHDIRKRQATAVELARRADLMLVIGGRHSANTSYLTKLCSELTRTYQVETAAEINPSWLEGVSHVGIAAGASTDEHTVDEVIAGLEKLSLGMNQI